MDLRALAGAALGLGLSLSARAEEPWTVVGVVDAGTLAIQRLGEQGWLELDGIRVPSLHAAGCPAEAQLAAKARAVMAGRFARARAVQVAARSNPSGGFAGSVVIDGRDLGIDLLGLGLAVRRNGPSPGWC